MLKMISKLSVAIALLLFTTVSIQAESTPAYYDAAYADSQSVQAKLQKEGFTILATYAPASKENLNVIIFTNAQLTDIASKKSRGFAAVQRVLIDSTAKTIRVTNPTYWLNAFMQEEFNPADTETIKNAITKALGQLTATKDALESKDLAGYHYAISMPYYKDMIELKSGDDLLSKINPKKKLFEVKLTNGSTLVGVKMSKTSEKFIETIGEDKALVLPYTILIEEGKAYALHAKYYLAISYPLLSLGEFMKISSVPDAIERKLKKSFK